MEHPVKTAPCPLLFAASGGKFTANGNPIIGGKAFGYYDIAAATTSEAGQHVVASLLCDTAFDCGVCPLMHEWVAAEHAQGWSVDWECWVCVKLNTHGKDGPGVDRRFPGFYQSGRPSGDDGSPDDRDDDCPPLTGCTSCGQPRSILQLVLRRPKMNLGTGNPSG
jgi:hypothetical protein